MAWLGEGLSSLSSLKGQITNFTKEVLSDGIVNEIDGHSKDLEEAHAKCNELQELLNSREAELAILRRQNNELQKTVVELRVKPNDSKYNNGSQDEDNFFWDPLPASKNRESKAQSQTKLLQEQLDQATMKIQDLETELSRVKTLNSSNVKDDANFKEEGSSQKTELLRAKQDVMNRIIQIGEKSREMERNAKRLQQDELTLVSDFRTAISKLASPEQYDLIRSALLALENENEQFHSALDKEKSDSDGFDVEGKKIVENNQVIELQRRIEELEAENQNLTTSMEELDKQNAESIERVLSLKEELQKKHQLLQTAYERLYVEYNEALHKIENLEQRNQKIELVKPSVKTLLDSAVQATIPISKADKETEVYLAKADKETEVLLMKEDKETEIDFKVDEQLDLTIELQKVKDILKNVQLETAEGEKDKSIFVNLARQFVDLKWKMETLERKLVDQSRELRETEENRYSLQIECEIMQTNLKSLLMEIKELKSCLFSIPEASEERVASLETETESLQQEIRTLRKSNADMSAELKAIKTAIKEDAANVDLARIEALLESKPNTNEKNPDEQLQSVQDENMALRRRLDVLESELRVSTERCKNLDENIELIEELKLDLENTRRELKITSSNNKRLENSLTILTEAKNELDADNEVLVREKEQLEADLKLLRESDLKRDDGLALSELRDELNKSKEEKDDLDYDIRNMRNELDLTLDELEAKRTHNEKLELDNDRLLKENNKLMDQFAESQKESLDKIELLNTEMTLLQQDLKECEERLEETMKKLAEMETKKSTIENENKQLHEEITRANEIRNENEILKKQLEEVLLQNKLNNNKDELNDALSRLKELEEKLLIFENENKRLQIELNSTENVSSDNQRLTKEIEEKQQNILKNEQEIANLTTKLKLIENSITALEDKNKILENEVVEKENLQIENNDLKKEIETINQQQNLEKKQKEEESIALKELTVKYQNNLERLRTFEEENQMLKIELNKLLVEKRDAEVNTSDLVANDKLPTETHISDEERLQFLNQLADKSKEIENLKATITKNTESALMARETVENLSQLISSKDNEIIKMNAFHDTLKSERDELIKIVQEKHNESLQYHSEIQRLTQLLNEQTVSMQKLVADKDANLEILKEKESQLLWVQNELQVVKQRLQNIEESNNHGEHCGIAEHTLLSKQVSAFEEKNKTLEAAILQDQSNIRYLQEQLTEAQSKEASALKEVERLRNHLVEMEANYTEEALQSEEIQRTLEAKLMQVEEKLKNSSTIYTSVSVRANQQVDTLQQQLALIMQQRDDLQNKISSAEDKVLSYSASLTNLQLVLEQFQRDKEKDIQAATEKLRIQLDESYKKQEDLTNETMHLKDQLAEAKECLLAASRLTEQLEKKSERIEQLNQEVSRLTELVNTADERIQEANKSGEGKIDRSLVKNLILGYISSPPNDKTAVLRVFANVLDFNETEREKAGLNSGSKSSWFSSLVNNGSTSSKDQEASLSTEFIKFLESESQPKPQLPALPISNSSIHRPGHSRQHSSSSTQSTLLLPNVTLPAFPDFVPARNTGSILKEVLKDS